MSDYFRLELLSRLPAAEAQFLKYTSVLDRMSGGLCDAVLGTTRSAHTLETLAEVVTSNVAKSLRSYFLGVTIIAAFNGVVIGIAAWIVGVPLAGTIAVVTFVAAYVPFVGAWVAGAFAVLIALGTVGTDAAVVMAVVSLLANSVLQQVIQPFVMGATLSLNPLVVLVVTIGAGALFGMVGLTLAAPLTSAAVHIATELQARTGPTARSEATRRPPADAT